MVNHFLAVVILFSTKLSIATLSGKNFFQGLEEQAGPGYNAREVRYV
jgi:hypothetical protein